MRHTGVFATKEEISYLKGLAARGFQPGQPIIALSVGMGMEQEKATVDAQKECHRIALIHGLPEIPGYYGITKDGEFLET